MKIAYWGSGPISNFHIPALRAANLNILSVYSRPESERPEEFSRRHDLIKSDSEIEFFNVISRCDAVVVALQTEATFQALKKLDGRVPYVFYEKPGALLADELSQLSESKTKYYSLYNRRHYNSVKRLKQFISESNTSVNIDIYFPDTKKGWHQFFINGCHIIDLMMYVTNDYYPQLKTVSKANEQTGFSFIAETKLGHLICFNNPWGAPQQAKITAYNGESCMVLQPLERSVVVHSFNIIEPSQKIPVRRYLPQEENEMYVDVRFKPGFEGQANAVRDLLEGKDESTVDKLGTLEQSISLLKFMELLKKGP